MKKYFIIALSCLLFTVSANAIIPPGEVSRIVENKKLTEQQKVSKLKTLLRTSKNAKNFVNEITTDWGSPLAIAAMRNYLKVAKFLIKNGANVNTTDTANWTPLHWAAQEGHKDMVVLLLKKGAKTSLKIETMVGHESPRDLAEKHEGKENYDKILILFNVYRKKQDYPPIIWE